MVYFKILLNKLLKKFPLKVLFIIIIVLLSFFIIKSNVFAYDTTFYYTYNSNNTDYVVEGFPGTCVLMGDINTGQPTILLYLASSSVLNSDYFPIEWTGTNSFNVYRVSNDYYYYRSFAYDSNNNSYRFDRQGTVYLNAVSYTDSFIIYCGNLPCKDYSNQNLYLNANTYNFRYVSHFIAPNMITDSNRIDDWSFYNLIFDSGSITAHYGTIDGNIPYRLRSFELEITYQGQVYTKDLSNYMYIYDSSTDLVTFNVPKQEIFNFANVYSGNTVQFDLIVTPDDNPNSSGNWSSYSLGTYTLNLTTAEEEQYNSDSDKQVLGDINYGINNLNQSQQDTNNKIDTFYNTLTDTSVDSGLSTDLLDLGDEWYIDDNTGIDNFFVIVYNYFCTNEPVSVELMLPFVNKPFVISSDNVSSFYTSGYKAFVSAIVYGAICLFILRDIRKMIDKMNEGNIENASHDIKREVL